MSQNFEIYGEIFNTDEVKEQNDSLFNEINESFVSTTSLVSSNAIVYNSENPLLSKMLNQVDKVDLIATLQDDLNDALSKYQDKAGNVNIEKVPRMLYIVAVMVELNKVAKKNGWAIALEDEMLYLYNGIYWERVGDGEFKQFLSKVAIKLGYYTPADAMTAYFADTALKQYLAHAQIKKQSRNNSVMINLLNGTYEVTENGGKLREHNPDDFLTYVLPFKYEPLAKAPLYQEYLNRVLPDITSQQVLQEFHGYVFIRHLKLEKALVLFGNGSNGKSVQFEITTALFGESNISTKTLGDLVDRDSGNDNRAKLKDKLLNYGSEIRAKSMDVDMFKRLVSGEPVTAREKYKTSFDLENTCKFMFNANKLPMEVERTEAYFRRFIIVPYEQYIEDDEKDPELHTKIINSELPGVLNWVIEGLHRLMLQKKFTECEAANNALETYRKESSSVALFLEEEFLVPSTTKTLPNRALYNMYSEWCNHSGMRRLGSRNLSKELVALKFESYRTGTERGFYIIQKIVP